MKTKIIILTGLFLFVMVTSSNAQVKGKTSKNMSERNKNLEIINKYLNIILIEKNSGKGLSDILAEDFVFDDPFVKASNAKEFIERNLHWINANKTYKMKKQFVDGNIVCSIYTIYLQKEGEKSIEIELVDYVEFKNGKMVNEKLYFDPTSQK